MGVLFSFLLSTRARVLCGFCTVRFWRLEPNICLSITCAQAEAFCRAFIADSKLMAWDVLRPTKTCLSAGISLSVFLKLL